MKHRLSISSAAVSILALALPVWAASEPAPLVKVGDKTLSENDLDAGAKSQLARAKADYFEAQKEAVDAFLFPYLVDLEAKATKVTSEQLLDTQVKAKTKKASAADIRAFYDNVKEKFGKQGRTVPPLDKVEDRIRTQLEQDSAEEAKAAYFARLKQKYGVKLMVERPRLDLAVGSNAPRGPAKAPVTIVMFSDFQCPYCRMASETVEKVVKEYRGKVRIYYRDFPLSFHQDAMPAALAARCAGEQDRFWPYHDKLFAGGKLGKDSYVAYAKELKLDGAKFEKCFDSQKYKAEIEKDIAEGSKAGVNGTPAFFVNGFPLGGGSPNIDKFKALINEELAALGPTARRAEGPIMP